MKLRLQKNWWFLNLSLGWVHEGANDRKKLSPRECVPGFAHVQLQGVVDFSGFGSIVMHVSFPFSFPVDVQRKQDSHEAQD